MKMRLPKEARDSLVALAKESGVRLEGNVLKVIDPEGDEEFKRYLDESLAKDKESRRKRLDITKQVQSQNLELQDAHAKLKTALAAAEDAKNVVEQDLNVLQKKTQFRLMHRIVNLAIGVVAAVGVVATGVYIYALKRGIETEHIGTVWSSLVGILLTNSFSILGTIMGVKYATDRGE
jgi:hypothetical protein